MTNINAIRRLSLAMVTALLCATASQAYDFKREGFYYNITSETNLEVEVTNKNDTLNAYKGRELMIPSWVSYNGLSYSVTRIGVLAFAECTKLVNVEIPSSVTSIGSAAFDMCPNLLWMEIPSSVTSIGSLAFGDCSSLKSVEIPSSLKEIELQTFYCCSSLTSVEIPSSVISIEEEAFYGCTSLTDVYSLNVTPPTCEDNIFNVSSTKSE